MNSKVIYNNFLNKNIDPKNFTWDFNVKISKNDTDTIQKSDNLIKNNFMQIAFMNFSDKCASEESIDIMFTKDFVEIGTESLTAVRDVSDFLEKTVNIRFEVKAGNIKIFIDGEEAESGRFGDYLERRLMYSEVIYGAYPDISPNFNNYTGFIKDTTIQNPTITQLL